MRNILLAGVAAGGLSVLAACSASQVSTAEADVQSIASDAETVLATGLIPQPAAGIAWLVLAGIRAVDSSVTAATGGSAETVAIAGLETAMKQAMADTTDATVQTAGGSALAALGALSATSSQSTVVQAEAAAGAVLVDYLTVKQPVSAVRAGAAPSAVAAALADARTRLTNLGR